MAYISTVEFASEQVEKIVQETERIAQSPFSGVRNEEVLALCLTIFMVGGEILTSLDSIRNALSDIGDKIPL